jgi:hypothetical protein
MFINRSANAWENDNGKFILWVMPFLRARRVQVAGLWGAPRAGLVVGLRQQPAWAGWPASSRVNRLLGSELVFVRRFALALLVLLLAPPLSL